MTVSLLVPVYQAEAFIVKTLQQLVCYAKRTPLLAEIVLIDDGSRDRTPELIDAFLSTITKGCFQLIRLPKNVGKGAAIKAGVSASKGDVIVFTDCDLPYAFKNIDAAIAQMVNHDAQFVVGCRMHPESMYHIRAPNLGYIYIRHTSGRLFNFLANVFTGLGLSDTQAGLKGFDRETAQLCFEKMTISGFAFDIDLLVCANIHHRRVVTIPLVFNYESEMSTVSFYKHAILMSGALIKIWLKRLFGRYGAPS